MGEIFLETTGKMATLQKVRLVAWHVEAKVRYKQNIEIVHIFLQMRSFVLIGALGTLHQIIMCSS